MLLKYATKIYHLKHHGALKPKPVFKDEIASIDAWIDIPTKHKILVYHESKCLLATYLKDFYDDIDVKFDRIDEPT